MQQQSPSLHSITISNDINSITINAGDIHHPRLSE
jgi:hypothetical protein